MDAETGDVYRLREQLLADTEIGDLVPNDVYEARLREIVDATSDERAAAEAKRLVRVGEQAARKLKLGAREQQRRRRRRR